MKPHNRKELKFVITAAIKAACILFLTALFLFLLIKIMNL